MVCRTSVLAGAVLVMALRHKRGAQNMQAEPRKALAIFLAEHRRAMAAL